MRSVDGIELSVIETAVAHRHHHGHPTAATIVVKNSAAGFLCYTSVRFADQCCETYYGGNSFKSFTCNSSSVDTVRTTDGQTLAHLAVWRRAKGKFNYFVNTEGMRFGRPVPLFTRLEIEFRSSGR